MRGDRADRASSALQQIKTGIGHSIRGFGRIELYWLLLLLLGGLAIDYWFNHHDLSWRSDPPLPNTSSLLPPSPQNPTVYSLAHPSLFLGHF